MKTLRLAMLMLMVMFVVVAPLMAQPAKDGGKEPQVKESLPSGSFAFSGSSIGAGLGAGLTIIGAGLGFGRIGSAALESMARQPEVAGRVQTAMLIIAALLEGATFFSLIVCIQVAGKTAGL